MPPRGAPKAECDGTVGPGPLSATLAAHAEPIAPTEVAINEISELRLSRGERRGGLLSAEISISIEIGIINIDAAELF